MPEIIAAMEAASFFASKIFISLSKNSGKKDIADSGTEFVYNKDLVAL
jgi:hypothetical protein